MTELFRTVCVALMVAGCTTVEPGPPVVAPYSKQYTCAELKQAAQELHRLPQDSMVARMVSDYGAERKALDDLHGVKHGRCR